MADPLSTIASIVTLVDVSVKLGVQLKRFHDGVTVVDSAMEGLRGDVEGLQRVLESMKDTFSQARDHKSFREIGHIGAHWRNLAKVLHDGQGTLVRLSDMLKGIDKHVTILDGPRKHLRLKTAEPQIAHCRQQIQCCRDILQLSLQTIIL